MDESVAQFVTLVVMYTGDMTIAARRTGAIALLKALQGTETIAIEVRGTGAATYRLADAIARFEAPRFPIDVPCPERGS